MQGKIRAKVVTLRAFSAQLSLLRPPGPLGRAITSGAFGAVCNQLDRVSQTCSYRLSGCLGCTMADDHRAEATV